VEAFCYRKKKAQTRRASQGTCGTGSRGSERSSAGSETQEILSTCGIARDPVKHELIKHVGVDAHFTRSQVQDGVVALQYVPSELQLADFFTKAQTSAHHQFYLSKLSVVDPS
jgi:hypothetical protein